jgi:3-(3-hydroxy-phenyl)propionate hydroxylase
MPDLDLVTAGGPIRTYSLLHRAAPVLLDLGGAGRVDDVAAWSDRVQVVSASCAGPWDLPVVGQVVAPAAVLIRPDGHVAWAGDESREGLDDALRRWC